MTITDQINEQVKSLRDEVKNLADSIKKLNVDDLRTQASDLANDLSSKATTSYEAYFVGQCKDQGTSPPVRTLKGVS